MTVISPPSLTALTVPIRGTGRATVYLQLSRQSHHSYLLLLALPHSTAEGLAEELRAPVTPGWAVQPAEVPAIGMLCPSVRDAC